MPSNNLLSETAGRPRQDSFDEAILDLPDLDALDKDFGFDFGEEKAP